MSSPRISGVTLPLFSLRTRRDWGIGQISDLPRTAAWLQKAGQKLLQILPAYELAAGETSPYGARTAFGLDPIYIDVDAVPELDPAAIELALGSLGLERREAARRSPRVDYAVVRALKERALSQAFLRFHEREWLQGTPRAKKLAAFIDDERAWVEDLALYVALREEHAGYGWESWPEGEKGRDASVLAEARGRLGERILFHQYGQFLAHEQWSRARQETNALGVELMGDLPFIIGRESADVWSRASQFRRDVSLGAPPDAFSEDGQDWGLPAYDWASMDADDLAWIRARTRLAGKLYDRFRLDHVVGYFRQYVRPHGARRGTFDPEGEEAERARGEKVLRAMQAAAAPAKIVAEDLGMVPPFARRTLRELGIPGYKVIPWEKDDRTGYREPRAFSALSVATWSTHDTPPIVAWWDELPPADRAALARMTNAPSDADDAQRSLVLLKTLFESGSELTLILAAELLGDRDRINTPGTVDAVNWTYRLPKPLEDLEADARISSRLEAVRQLVVASGR